MSRKKVRYETCVGSICRVYRRSIQYTGNIGSDEAMYIYTTLQIGIYIYNGLGIIFRECMSVCIYIYL